MCKLLAIITLGSLSFVTGGSPNVLDQPTIVLFYGNSYDEHRAFLIPNATDILKQPEYDDTKKNLLYIHGYNEQITDEHIRLIVSSYQARGDHNIFVLNWSAISAANFFLVTLSNFVKFGKILTTALMKMESNGFKLECLHIVGHSLGAQLTSQVAQGIIRESQGKKKLKRISGLDPGFMFFYPNTFTKHISSEDAEFVDIIYTDAPPNTYGTPVKTGHANFWPNGNNVNLQPGCVPRDFVLFGEIELCSHRRSWRYWAESVSSAPGTTFYARKCESWFKFKAHKCDSNEIVNFGIDCPPTTGDFFFQTNSESPFSMGLDGTKYKNTNLVNAKVYG